MLTGRGNPNPWLKPSICSILHLHTTKLCSFASATERRRKSFGIKRSDPPTEGSSLPINLGSDNQNILFIVDRGSTILFYLGNIYALLPPLNGDDLPENSKNGFLWLLFDTPSPSSPIPLVANSALCFPIQTPSPNPTHYSAWRKHRRPLYTAFSIWSVEELRR
ncbi:hypothetical protein F5148DRAFT_1156135, partial [Russula earlei]